MSELAVSLYDKSLNEQHSRNEARRILTRVTEARRSIPSAGKRWPFELLQNALDFGSGFERSSVSIRLSCESGLVAFEHDGVPFETDDLTALLTGGSNKEFESEETTGRFGTGFLVTHVLAERARLRGLLKTTKGYEQFNLLLDRGGDEQAILKNMHACRGAINNAAPVSVLDGIPSARFEYEIDDENPLALGIDSLRSALPYLYATRQSLGRAELQGTDSADETWEPTEPMVQSLDDYYVESRTLKVQRDGSAPQVIRVFRFSISEQGLASAIVIVEQTGNGWKIVHPGENSPRIYKEYPLSGSGFLPTNFILDGKFDPDQERNRLLMSDKDKELVAEAFGAAVVAVKFAFDNKWEDAHLLAKVCKPSGSFDAADTKEKEWWAEQLKSFAQKVAELPIVAGTAQMWPAVSQHGGTADFIIPSLFPDSSLEETSVERMWPLVESATDLLPPTEKLAPIWTEVAQGWNGLGVKINRISLTSLAASVKDDSNTLDELRIVGDAKEWLSLFLDVAGQCWKKRDGIYPELLNGILPDQNRRLRSPSDLTRDDGIPESLKDICFEIGLNVRGRLIDSDLQNAAVDGNLPNLEYALEWTLPNLTTEEDVLKQAIGNLRTLLPEDGRSDDIPIGVKDGSVRLLQYIWETRGQGGAILAQQVPIITNANIARRWSRTRMMMAPVSHWHKSGQPFARAYPPNRVLAEMYTGSASGNIPNCVNALVNWGIAFADPISSTAPAELTDKRLAELSPVDTEGITVRHNIAEFSQIALLQPALLNRSQAGIEEARALFGLVLCHVAPHDSRWRKKISVKGRQDGREIEIAVADALWLADLKSGAWVPQPGEDGKPVPTLANAKTLYELLEPSWLEKNDSAIRLLSEWFDFDQLDLRLLGTTPDSKEREQLRDGLASLVEVGGANPAFYSSLSTLAGLAGSDMEVYSSLTDLAKLAKSGDVNLTKLVETQKRQSRDINKFRDLGIGVQEAIKVALENHQLKLKFFDIGFDYEVNLPDGDVQADSSSKIEVGPYLLEVKATTTGHARMTPLQAKTASEEAKRYVLCVVDLRSMQNGQLPDTWSASMVEPLAKIVPDIGARIRGTYSLVETARNRVIAVRNEAALRYEVPSVVWETGKSIGEWVSTIKTNNASQVSTP